MKVIAVVVCLLVSLAQGQAQLEWKLVFPVCPGYVQALAFPSSKTIILVGTIATALRSDDGGRIWKSCDFPFRSDWYDVVCLAPGIVVCVGADGRIARSTDQGVTWTFSDSPTTASLYRVWTDSLSVIVAVGDSGAMVRSTDAGVTWATITSECKSLMRFIGSSPSGRLHSYDTSNVLQYSDDKGQSWSLCIRDSSWQLLGCHMFSLDSGFIIGEYDGIGITTDGGRAWTSIELDSSPNVGRGTVENPMPRIAAFISRDSIGRYAAVYDNGQIALSKESILEWKKSTLLKEYRASVTDLETDSSGRRWLVSPGNLTELSNSGTIESVFQFPSRPPTFEASGLMQDGTAFFGAPLAPYTSKCIQITNDSGRTWRNERIDLRYDLVPTNVRDIDIVEPGRWIMSGIYFESGFNGDGSGYSQFRALESTDHGASWREYKHPARQNSQTTAFDVGRNGAACTLGGDGMSISVDDYGTWRSVLAIDPNGKALNLKFCLAVSPRLFFAYGGHRALYRSSDSGRTLQRIEIPSVDKIRDMMFADDDFGVCVGDQGDIFRTTDAGISWTKVASGTAYELHSVFVKSRSEWLVGGDDLKVITTKDGGATWHDISIPNTSAKVDITNVVFIGDHEYLASGRAFCFRGKDLGGSTSVPDSTSSRHAVTSSLLSISPNPSMNSATITVADRSPVLRLYDASGRFVSSYTVENGRVVVNTSELSNGVYNVVSDTGSGVLMVNR
ncbi:MAG: T9SS type A sorting domain-containing protein [Ignavibacteria bacterium]|nr:T9SS type A sorting domain-containing protein [Ignavibacteria bacterium]MBK7411448.1 T9SS type A sorting domain-containing protein [Ignavibacteria bacterium]